jgi:hypothetical protein
MCTLLIVQVAVVRRLGILDSQALLSLVKPAAVSALTVALAVGLEIFVPGFPDPLSGAIVVLSFMLLVALIRPVGLPRVGTSS